MSTRSMTVVREVRNGSVREVNLYRHCDGYPAYAGAALIKAVGRSGNYARGEDVVAALLGCGEDYQVVMHKPEEQSDLEHVYVIERGADGWVLSHYERTDWRKDTYTLWNRKFGTLAQFTVYVNECRAELNSEMERRGLELHKLDPVVL